MWSLCVDMISYKEEGRSLLLSGMMVGDLMAASIDHRAERKTAVSLYLIDIRECSPIKI